MNTQEINLNLDAAVRTALGDLTLQLVVARAENESLKARLAEIETAGYPAKPNGKFKGKEPQDAPEPRPQ